MTTCSRGSPERVSNGSPHPAFSWRECCGAITSSRACVSTTGAPVEREPGTATVLNRPTHEPPRHNPRPASRSTRDGGAVTDAGGIIDQPARIYSPTAAAPCQDFCRGFRGFTRSRGTPAYVRSRHCPRLQQFAGGAAHKLCTEVKSRHCSAHNRHG